MKPLRPTQYETSSSEETTVRGSVKPATAGWSILLIQAGKEECSSSTQCCPHLTGWERTVSPCWTCPVLLIPFKSCQPPWAVREVDREGALVVRKGTVPTFLRHCSSLRHPGFGVISYLRGEDGWRSVIRYLNSLRVEGKSQRRSFMSMTAEHLAFNLSLFRMKTYR